MRDDWISLGAALTLSELERGPAGEIPVLAELFEQFASRLIRNGATLGGNLGTASPIGDAAPALLALDAALVLASPAGERTVPLSEYFTGYRQSVKRPDELIRAVRIPTPVAPISAFHKIAKRRFDDISGVAVGYALRLSDDPAAGAATRCRDPDRARRGRRDPAARPRGRGRADRTGVDGRHGCPGRRA